MRLVLRLASVVVALGACATRSTPPGSPGRAGIAPQGREASAAMTEPAITARDLRLRLTTFADDSMMGREAGTRGNFRGTEYLATEAKRLGLRPAGEEGTFFQTVHLVERSPDPSSRIVVANAELELGTDFVPFMGPGPFTPGGSLDGIQAIYAGRVGAEATLDSSEVAGKLVVLDPALDAEGNPVMPTVEDWRRETPKYRSAAMFAPVLLDLLPPRYVEFLTQTRTFMGDPGAAPAQGPFAIPVTAAAAEKLLGEPTKSAQVGTVGPTLSGAVRIIQRPVDYPARNVIAVLPSSDPGLRGQYVALGAHNDHLGIGSDVFDHDSIRAYDRVVRPQGADSPPRPPNEAEVQAIRAILDSLRAERTPRPDSIYNGADDDGSGSVALLEIAELFATRPGKPDRSNLFVWHTAEEEGLFGSRYFTEHPTVPRDSIVAQVNLDMIGRGDAGDIEDGGPGYLQVIGSRRLSTELGDLVEQVNATNAFGFQFDYQYDAPGDPGQYYCRSDHYMYARFGIPIVFFSTGGHRDYHQVTDEPQYIDYPKMARITELSFDIADEIANLDHRLVVDKPKPDPNAPCEQ